LAQERKRHIKAGNLTDEQLDKLLSFQPRIEKLISKDVKLRTFITDDSQRNDMVSQVYEMTYEVIKKKIDTIVVIDDSIVRGTTLEKSILTMLDKLEPKRIIIVSSAPQIRYPDCYGIDMSRVKEFVAFRAAIQLLKDRGMDNVIDQVYEQCLAASKSKAIYSQNFVKQIYEHFTHEEISAKVAEIVNPKSIKADVSVIFQTIEDLHLACPNHKGDWYFSGDYPTKGGNKVVNQAFINYYKGIGERAY
jgi:amidophosphoribosyltransferase